MIYEHYSLMEMARTATFWEKKCPSCDHSYYQHYFVNEEGVHSKPCAVGIGTTRRCRCDDQTWMRELHELTGVKMIEEVSVPSATFDADKVKIAGDTTSQSCPSCGHRRGAHYAAYVDRVEFYDKCSWGGVNGCNCSGAAVKAEIVSESHMVTDAEVRAVLRDPSWSEQLCGCGFFYRNHFVKHVHEIELASHCCTNTISGKMCSCDPQHILDEARQEAQKRKRDANTPPNVPDSKPPQETTAMFQHFSVSAVLPTTGEIIVNSEEVMAVSADHAQFEFTLKNAEKLSAVKKKQRQFIVVKARPL